MGDVYKKAKDLFEKEFEKIVDKGEINDKTLDYSYKLADIIKDINKICDYEEEREYDESYSGRRGYSMRRSRDYQMMPPMSNWYPMEGNYSYGYGRGYSGDYGRGMSNASPMKSKLHQLLNEASNDRERMMIQSWIDELGNL